MKEKIFSVFAICVALLGIGLVNAAGTESSEIITTVHPSVINISVPDEIIIPDIAPGYNSGDIGFDIVNVGTQDISISTELDHFYGGDIYTNLFFKEDLSDVAVNVNDFTFNLARPTIVGTDRLERIFVSLNLTEMDSSLVSETLENYTTDIIFTAVPMLS